jgi:hypothetical protein
MKTRWPRRRAIMPGSARRSGAARFTAIISSSASGSASWNVAAAPEHAGVVDEHVNLMRQQQRGRRVAVAHVADDRRRAAMGLERGQRFGVAAERKHVHARAT